MFTHKCFILTVLFVLVVLASSVSAEGTWTSHGSIKDSFGNFFYATAGDVEDNNVIWFGADLGAYSFDGYGGIILMTDITTESSLPHRNVNAVAIDHDNVKWFGSYGNVSMYDDTDKPTAPTWKHYTVEDGLAGNWVSTITIDADNNIWIGTSEGLSFFDRTTWITYTTEDGLGGNRIEDIFIDADNNVWVGTGMGGVSVFDGENWKTYTAEDGLVSGIAYNMVTAIAVDHNNVKWFGSGGGLSRFDGVNWTPFTIDDVLPHYYVQTVTVDQNNVVWVGTIDGVVSFDGYTWATYTTANGLCDNNVIKIIVDKNNVKWFLTNNGVSSFNDNSSTSVEESEKIPQNINIRGNFPNPFNPTTTIEFSLVSDNQVAVGIYNIAGQKVRTLVNGQLSVGNYSVVWDGKNEAGSAVSSGMYLCQITAGNFVGVHKMTLAR